MKFDETPGIAGVYLLICRETREYYVGESKDIVLHRLRAYRHIERGGKTAQPLLGNKLRARYLERGDAQFEMWLLETGLHDAAERLSRETHWDGYWLARGYTRLNVAKTGQRSPMLGRTASAETRAKISKAHRGKRITPETRAKMSEAHRGKKMPPFTAETRAKISEAHRGKRITAETRAKMSKAHRGKNLTAETRAKMSKAQRKYWAARKAQTNAECNGSSGDVA